MPSIASKLKQVKANERNATIKRMKAKALRKITGNHTEYDALADDIISRALLLEEEAENIERGNIKQKEELLSRVLALKDEEEQLILIEYYFNDATLEDIADRINLSKTGTYNKKEEALQKIEAMQAY